jgi:hypothetical protein
LSTRIERASSSDLEALAELFDGYRQFYGRASEPDAGREFLRARLENEDSALFIAYDGETQWDFASSIRVSLR